MFPERKDCMHIFSTEGRAFFAVWLQAVEGCVSGYMAALRDEAWREAMATLRALVAALEEFMMESDRVFAAWEQGEPYTNVERLEGRVAAVESAATGCFEAYRPVLRMMVLEMMIEVRRAQAEDYAARKAAEARLSASQQRERARWQSVPPPGTPDGRESAGRGGYGRWSAPDEELPQGVACNSEPPNRYACAGRVPRLRGRLWWFRAASAWNALMRALHGSGGCAAVG